MKRGAVSIFIFIGILIVALVGVTFYFRGEIVESFKKTISQEIFVQEDIEDIKTSIGFCINSLTLDAVNLISLQGGYFTVPKEDLAENEVDIFSNKVSMGSIDVPYWSYEKSNGIAKTQIPSKGNMEKDIEDYVLTHLFGCLDLNQFEGYEFEITDIDVNADIKKKFIDVKVMMPVKVINGDRETLLEEFEETIDVPLGEMYSLAKEITEKIKEDNFLEEKTYDIMVVSEDIPVSGTEFSCTTRLWDKGEVYSALRKGISYNFNYIDVVEKNKKGDDYYKWGLLDDSDNVDVDVIYNSGWPMYMDVFPSEGNILKSDNVINNEQLNSLLRGFFCINDYNFVYDVKFPVLFVLSKDNYNFQFANMVIIDNNQPKENVYGENIEIESIDFCENKNKDVDVTVLVDDGFGFYRLADGNLRYSCGTYSCNAGKIKDGEFNGDVISCLNGRLIANADGYSEGSVEFSSVNEDSAVILVKPIYEIDYDIKLINKATGVVSDVEDQDVMFTFKTEGYTTSISNGGKVRLTSGIYEVNAYVLDSKGVKFTIPGQKIENCVDVPSNFIMGLLGFTKEECVTNEIPEIEIEENLVGKIKFNWVVYDEDLVNAEKITFYALYDNRPSSLSDLRSLYSSLENMELGRFFVYPKLE